MTSLSYYSNLCLEAWINCENIISNSSKKKIAMSNSLKNSINECAHICLGTFHAIKTKSCNTNNIVLLCIGICEECAELCEDFSDDVFIKCAEACRNCSSNLMRISLYATSAN